ncbi:MAG: hypothetical protein N3A69_14030 [Leptospiraceae bacterium]|nr:hypothetical protein [Leptospiraceae bacterium]
MEFLTFKKEKIVLVGRVRTFIRDRRENHFIIFKQISKFAFLEKFLVNWNEVLFAWEIGMAFAMGTAVQKTNLSYHSRGPREIHFSCR